jgi:CRISPR-associated protein Csx10
MTTLTVEFLSDWHVGAGRGRAGDIDRTVLRDVDGLPYVPAKTLTGVLRDRCEAVAAALGGDWPHAVAELFGSQPAIDESPTGAPSPARLSVRAARSGAGIAATLSSSPVRAELLDALTVVRPGVAVDAFTGTASTDMLRFTEMARRGSFLTGSVELDPSLADSHRALFVAGAALVDAVGGDRRRGGGRCKVEVDPEVLGCATAAELAGRVHDLLLRPPAPPATATYDDPSATEPVPVGGLTTASVEVVVDLVDPVVVAVGRSGNTVRSLDHVPGAMLLAALAPSMGAAGIDVPSALAARHLVVGDARPDVDRRRGRPTPLSLHAAKDTPGLGTGDDDGPGATDRVRNAFGSDDPFETGADFRQIRGGHVADAGEAHLPPWSPAGSLLTTGTHNSVLDGLQRPASDTGGVYTYEAIRAGTRLRATVTYRGPGAEEVLRRLATAAPAEVRVGTAKKDDYGRARISVGDASTVAADLWTASELEVWCESDVVVVDPATGRPTTTAQHLAECVADAFGVGGPVEPVPGSVFVRAGRRDSFHARWGLPRMTLPVVAAGSCVKVRRTDGQPVTVDRSLLALGVGERTGEGFGQVSVGDPLVLRPMGTLASAPASESGPDPLAAGPGPSPGPDADLYLAALREVWVRHAQTAARTATGGARGTVARAQLGALRHVAGRLGPYERANAGTRFVEQVAANKRRSDVWAGSVDDLRTLFDDPSRVWELLGADTLPEFGTAVGERLRTQLWGRAVQALVVAVTKSGNLRALAPRNDEEGTK